MKKDSFQKLEKALLFFYVSELKALLLDHGLSLRGKKRIFVQRLIHFFKTGERVETLPFPLCSYARRGENYPLHPKTLILKGSYKNDLKTRLFLKKLIGSHFHFTVFGQDWIMSCWERGQPPSYEEFAKIWQKEYERRQREGGLPKEEWAYIRFVQDFIRQLPNPSRALLLESWEKERQKQVAIAKDILRTIEVKD